FTTDPKMVITAIHNEGNQSTGKDQPGSVGSPTLDQTPSIESAGCGSGALNDAGLKELKLWLTLYKTAESLQVFRDRNARYDSLSALQQLAQWLSGVPGRKTLIWAGSAVQLYGGMNRVVAGNGPQRNYSTVDFQNISQATEENAYTFMLLAAANVAVYPLD